jgi:putative tryptophan/tyrosine transport system substrate-binding protein
MRRRQFITLLGSAAVARPRTARAQQPAMPLIGVLRVNPKGITETFAEPFRRYMRAVGWEEGRNIRFLFVWAAGQNERLPELAEELVAAGVNTIIAFGDPGVKAAQRASAHIPIVGMTSDLVYSGAVASMTRPGGNTTGVSILASELDLKRLELLHAFVPQARRIGLLVDPTVTRDRSQFETGARLLGVEIEMFDVGSREEIPQALNAMAAAGVEAVNILSSPLLNSARGLIIEHLRGARLPAIYEWPETAEEGGFLAYGPRYLLCYRLVVGLTDKILRGARPADLPVQQPDRFELVLNLKTAGELGLTFSAPLLLRVDQVVE